MSRIQAAVRAVASAEPTADTCQPLVKRAGDQWHCRRQLRRRWEAIHRPLRTCLRKLVGGRLPWPLYLHGPVRAGKSRAMLALCDKLEFARYWTLNEVRQSMAGHNAPWQGSWGLVQERDNQVSGPRLAILDEIGMHMHASDWEYDALMGFYEWREDRPAIYVSNHPAVQGEFGVLTQIYDKRIESRLLRGTVFCLPPREEQDFDRP